MRPRHCQETFSRYLIIYSQSCKQHAPDRDFDIYVHMTTTFQSYFDSIICKSRTRLTITSICVRLWEKKLSIFHVTARLLAVCSTISIAWINALNHRLCVHIIFTWNARFFFFSMSLFCSYSFLCVCCIVKLYAIFLATTISNMVVQGITKQMPSTHLLFCGIFHSHVWGKNVAWQQTEAFVGQTEQWRKNTSWKNLMATKWQLAKPEMQDISHENVTNWNVTGK